MTYEGMWLIKSCVFVKFLMKREMVTPRVREVMALHSINIHGDEPFEPPLICYVRCLHAWELGKVDAMEALGSLFANWGLLCFVFCLYHGYEVA